jgi:hypothetical protein
VVALKSLELKLVGFAIRDKFATEFALLFKFFDDLFLALFWQIRSLALRNVLVIAMLLSLLERSLEIVLRE